MCRLITQLLKKLLSSTKRMNPIIKMELGTVPTQRE